MYVPATAEAGIQMLSLLLTRWCIWHCLSTIIILSAIDHRHLVNDVIVVKMWIGGVNRRRRRRGEWRRRWRMMRLSWRFASIGVGDGRHTGIADSIEAPDRTRLTKKDTWYTKTETSYSRDVHTASSHLRSRNVATIACFSALHRDKSVLVVPLQSKILIW